MARQDIRDDPAAALPALRQFLGGYFHQDWVFEHDGWQEVVGDFVSESTRADVAACAADLTDLLGAGLTDDELTTVVERVGGSVETSALDLTTGAWLSAVLAQLHSA